MTEAERTRARRAIEKNGFPKILNASQVADMFGCSPKTVRTWVKGGHIPYFRLPGGRLRFRRYELEEWVDARAQYDNKRRA